MNVSLRGLAIALLGLLALSAVPPGWLLVIRPDGSALQMPLSLLAGTPFADFRLPGAILLVVIGGGALAAATLAWRRHAWAPRATQLVGLALMGWMAGQVVLIGFSSWLQPVCAAWGLLLFGIGLWWQQVAAPKA